MRNTLRPGIPMLRKPLAFLTTVVLAIAGTAPAIFPIAVGPANAKFPTLFGEVHGRAVAINSGVNAVAFTLGFFHKAIHPALVAGALGAGAGWDHAPSVRRVRQALVSSGLDVALRKGVTFANVSSELLRHPRRSLAIVRLKDDWSKDLYGHYIVFCSGGPLGLSVVDVGRFVGWESVASVHRQLKADFNGQVMFVRADGSRAATHIYTPKSNRIILNAGEIASGPGMVRIKFLLKNISRKPVGLTIARGTCYCFRGATIDEPDHEISPGRTAEISLDFKRDAIGVGRIDREVLLKFTGNPKHWITVFVRAHVTVKHPPVQLTWYPSQIDLGVVRHRRSLVGEAITVLVPRGDSVGPPASSSRSLSVTAAANRGGIPQTDNFGRIVHSYLIDTARLPQGLVDDRITITTTDEYVPKIVIPITGQVERAVGNSGGADR